MKAIFVEKTEKIEMKDIDIPTLKSDDVLIKVAFAGICGSDIHTYKGLHPFRKPPVVIGHEVSGVVVRIGDAVTELKIGDRVTVEPQLGTGESEGIMTGNVNYSDNRMAPGMGTWLGTMAEYFAAPESVVVKLPDYVTFEQGVLVEPLAVGVHASYKGQVKAGEKVAILGAGPIGLLTLAAVKHHQAGETLITDILEYSLDYAKHLGANYAINITGKTNWIEEAKALVGGSFDKVFITAGVSGIVSDALHLLRKGGRVITVAMFHDKQEIDIEDLQQKEKEIVGSMTYNRSDTLEALDIIKTGIIPVDQVISHVLDSKDAAYGFTIVDKKQDESVKVLVGFNSL